MTDIQHERLVHGKHIIDIEISALEALRDGLDASFSQAVECILGLQGRLVIVGMGKSGIIAKKLAATFASTGTPAFFVHAAEAQHGDLGMITAQDAVLALSHSGETTEVCSLLPTIKRLGAPVIAITGQPKSSLGQFADICLHVPVTQEACPLNLAPTASTTAALALGDALAVVTLKQRGFQAEDFARVHPAGSLGRKLLRICDVMHTGANLPVVTPDTCLREAIIQMSGHRFGITAVQNEHGDLLGCLTDGDLRRLLETDSVQLGAPISEVMHAKPHTIQDHVLASEAIHHMETLKITALFVVNDTGSLVGITHLHDLLHSSTI